jgi:hypothetical protein
MVWKTWYGFAGWYGRGTIAIFLGLALSRIAVGVLSRPRRWQPITLLAGGFGVLGMTYFAAQPVAMVTINGGPAHLHGGPLAGVGVTAALGVGLFVLAMIELRIPSSSASRFSTRERMPGRPI